MKRIDVHPENPHTSGPEGERTAKNHKLRLGLGIVGLFGALSLAGCGSAMGVIAAIPDVSAASEEDELVASLGLDDAATGTWDATVSGPTIDFSHDYYVQATAPYGTSKAVSDLYADSSEGAGNRKVVHTDDYLGDSKNVGLAFTRAVVDDANSRYAPEG